MAWLFPLAAIFACVGDVALAAATSADISGAGRTPIPRPSLLDADPTSDTESLGVEDMPSVVHMKAMQSGAAQGKAYEPAGIKEVVHVKAPGGGYSSGSPLFAKQQAPSMGAWHMPILHMHNAQKRRQYQAQALRPNGVSAPPAPAAPSAPAVTAPPRRERPFMFDTFFVVYWTVVAIFLGCIGALYLSGHCFMYAEDTTDEEEEEVENEEVELPNNMWSLNLVAAIGQAKFSNDRKVPVSLVALISCSMGAIQLLALFLIVHDIDPNATPVTSVPSSAWVKDSWTVNSMKWIMAGFLCVLLVNEVGQCKMVVNTALRVNHDRLEVTRVLPMVVVTFQYLIALVVVWASISAVLSFQSVPDAVYSSMSITFIIGVDEAMFEFLSLIFDIDADFTILHKTSSGAMEKGELDKHQMLHKHQVYLSMLLKGLIVYPLFLGTFLIGRAFYTNVMPHDRVASATDWLMGITHF